ncbi:MAG: GNAT family N-acetyltransferase [Gemmatimonadota bacterium]|jgi:phosphinothricin acetyltransferase
MKIEIRLGRESDAESCLEIYRPLVETTAVSFELEPPDEDGMRARIARTLRTHPWLVAEMGGTVEGYAYAGTFRHRPAYSWTCETTVYVRERSRGRGVGRALYAPLLACLDVQGFRTQVAVITRPNPASIALHRSLGFTRVGVFHDVGWKLGRWHDTEWLERRRGGGPPGPIRVAAELAGTAEWAAALATTPEGPVGEGPR